MKKGRRWTSTQVSPIWEPGSKHCPSEWPIIRQKRSASVLRQGLIVSERQILTTLTWWPKPPRFTSSPFLEWNPGGVPPCLTHLPHKKPSFHSPGKGWEWNLISCHQILTDFIMTCGNSKVIIPKAPQVACKLVGLLPVSSHSSSACKSQLDTFSWKHVYHITFMVKNLCNFYLPHFLGLSSDACISGSRDLFPTVKSCSWPNTLRAPNHWLWTLLCLYCSIPNPFPSFLFAKSFTTFHSQLRCIFLRDALPNYPKSTMWILCLLWTHVKK